MRRRFNVTGSCNPQEHYMVNLDSRLKEIKYMIDNGMYFTINRGRQYGKTTILEALESYLADSYTAINLDFQFLSSEDFETESNFTSSFTRELCEILKSKTDVSESVVQSFELLQDKENLKLGELFRQLSQWCRDSEKPIVLMIDEVDHASNNQIFLDFLAQLRGYFLKRSRKPTFRSVILAGVHDVRNLRQKLRPDSEHRHNSPWNIAVSFDVDMSFSAHDIAGMLLEYEKDNQTGMDIKKMSELIYDYTSGYPVLVSGICRCLDEKIRPETNAWTKEGFLEAIRMILLEKSSLFESLINKLEDDKVLRNLVYGILFEGQRIPFNPYDAVISNAMMYGFVKNDNNIVTVSNRIFETVIYNWFMSIEMTTNEISITSSTEKNLFIENGQLNMEKILERFVQTFTNIYGSKPEAFIEDVGRKYFMLFVRPIINGTGNYYVESRTRDNKRTDLIIDYHGKQYIVELKIWHGEEYNIRGENQLIEYLDYYETDVGYMLSFNFNKNKQIGVHSIEINGKRIVEAVV